MYIRNITIQNFKQLKNVKLDLQKNTTLLAGPNNSGKTSLILLLKRILTEKSFTFKKSDLNAYDKYIWSNEIYKIIKDIHESKTDINIDELITELSNKMFPNAIEDDVSLVKDITIPELAVKFQIDYTAEDNISYFANYIMDLDSSSNSFYFLIKVVLNKDDFFSSIKDNSNKILSRLNNNDNDDKKESIIDLVLDIYCDNLVSKYYFTDSNYNVATEIANSQEFRDLFNFEYIIAARPVSDSTEKENHELSNALIGLAKKDKDWENTIKDLPYKIFDTFDQDKISSTLQTISATALNSLINSVSRTNGGHTGTINLNIDVTEDHVQKLIKNTTNAQFSISDTEINTTYLLNENSQGLGYNNLIYMHTQIENYIKSKDKLKINFLVIEEPESHMHPQMQYVFSRRLLEQYDEEDLQGLITTHSSEIVRGVSIEKLRVIREDTLFNSKIYNLSLFVNENKNFSKGEINDESLVKDFKSFYEDIGISELVFADVAVLYEGDTERLYLKKIVSLPEYEGLQQKYIAYIQVGGAYAYNFKSILEYLKIKSLIITDVDYTVKSPRVDKEILLSTTSNATLKSFFDDDNFNKNNKPKPQMFNVKIQEIYRWITNSKHIVSKIIKKTLDGKETEKDLIYLAFQTENDKYTRTLESAMLSKKFGISGYEVLKRSDWIKKREDSKLLFSIPNNYIDSETKVEMKDSTFDLMDILNSTSKHKTDFMYSVILNGFAEEMLPDYIKEGLEWLMK